jgi:hypothetical protein
VTTIAFDGRTIAGDSQYHDNGYVSYAPKVVRSCGYVYAIAGLSPMFEPLIVWHQKGAVPSAIPIVRSEEDALLVVAKGAYCVTYTLSVPYPDIIVPPYAWGTGAAYAIAAMRLGKTAFEAVELSIECDRDTGGAITVEVLDNCNT